MRSASPTEELPLYRRVLGPGFDRLAPEIQALHDLTAAAAASGHCTITRGRHPLSQLAGWLFAMPSETTGLPISETTGLPIRVGFEPLGEAEIWRRHFGNHRLVSVQRPGPRPGLLVERFGVGSFLVAVSVADGGLRLDLRGVRLLGLPLPRFLWPRVRAGERSEKGCFVFDVEIHLPLAGLLVHYHGTLRLHDAATPPVHTTAVNPA